MQALRTTISKLYEFSAGHHLRGLAEGHKCARKHGHNYVVRVGVSSCGLDLSGFVVDYAVLDTWVTPVIREFDHVELNELPDFRRTNPSAENIARLIWDKVDRAIQAEGINDNQDDPRALVRVEFIEVSETPKTNCRLERDSV